MAEASTSREYLTPSPPLPPTPLPLLMPAVRYNSTTRMHTSRIHQTLPTTGETGVRCCVLPPAIKLQCLHMREVEYSQCAFTPAMRARRNGSDGRVLLDQKYLYWYYNRPHPACFYYMYYPSPHPQDARHTRVVFLSFHRIIRRRR